MLARYNVIAAVEVAEALNRDVHSGDQQNRSLQLDATCRLGHVRVVQRALRLELGLLRILAARRDMEIIAGRYRRVLRRGRN